MIVANNRGGDNNLGKKGLKVNGKFTLALTKKKQLTGKFNSLKFRECKWNKKKKKCSGLFKTEFKISGAEQTIDEDFSVPNPTANNVSLANCVLAKGKYGGTNKVVVKLGLHLKKKFGGTEKVKPLKKNPKNIVKSLSCDVGKHATKDGSVKCQIKYGMFAGFRSAANVAVEKDAAKFRKNRAAKLKNKAKKGRKKAKKRKSKRLKFLKRNAKGKKRKAKFSKKRKKKKGKKAKKSKKKKGKKAKKSKKKCKKTCKKKHKKGKKRSRCLKKCK